MCVCVCSFSLVTSGNDIRASALSLYVYLCGRSFVLLRSIRAEDERGLWRFYFRGSWLVVGKLILPGDSGDNVALATFNYSDPSSPIPFARANGSVSVIRLAIVNVGELLGDRQPSAKKKKKSRLPAREIARV